MSLFEERELTVGEVLLKLARCWLGCRDAYWRVIMCNHIPILEPGVRL